MRTAPSNPSSVRWQPRGQICRRALRAVPEQTNSPRAPPHPRRGPNAANIMYDKRVVRGNTYAAQILPATAQAEQLEMERQAQRTHNTTKKIKTVGKPSTPEAVDGRKHIDVQTEQYLEELTDRPVEVDIDTQARTARAPPPAPPALAPPPRRHLADDLPAPSADGRVHGPAAGADLHPDEDGRRRRDADLRRRPLRLRRRGRADPRGAGGQDLGAVDDGGDGGGGARGDEGAPGAL